MRKAEIVQRIAQELECTTAKAETAVEAILTTIKASLRQGEPVTLNLSAFVDG
jgi:nucleoid DNA-binding protein